MGDAEELVSANPNDRAYETIATLIRSRRLKGGDVIVEARLASSLGISLTPLREALQRPRGRRLGGARPGPLSDRPPCSTCANICRACVREIVEPEAAALACSRVPQAEIAAIGPRRKLAENRAPTTSRRIGAPTEICTSSSSLIAGTTCSSTWCGNCGSRRTCSRSPGCRTGWARMRPNTSLFSTPSTKPDPRLRAKPFRPTSKALPVRARNADLSFLAEIKLRGVRRDNWALGQKWWAHQGSNLGPADWRVSCSTN